MMASSAFVTFDLSQKNREDASAMDKRHFSPQEFH